jgi:hypothetical protein
MILFANKFCLVAIGSCVMFLDLGSPRGLASAGADTRDWRFSEPVASARTKLAGINGEEAEGVERSER